MVASSNVTIDARHPSGATDWEEIHQDAIHSPSHQKHAPVSEVLMVTWGHTHY